MFGIGLSFKKTSFKAGFLNLNIQITLTSDNHYKAVDKFIAPRKIDNRDMCLSSNSQGDTPYCAAYSTAGYIEYMNWKTKHYPEQIDAESIYKRAKELENNPYDGTTYDYVVKAVNELNLIKGKAKFLFNKMDVQFAVHQYGVCMGAFNITDEWNSVHRSTGLIDNYGDRAQKLGGHGILICGFDKQGVYIQNSWGEDWGIYGFAILDWNHFAQQFQHGVIIEPF